MGFYTIIILVACKIILIALEILCNRRNVQRNIYFLAIGYSSAFLALILGFVPFKGFQARIPEELGQCENADADIVGDGVRAAAWIQVGILFLITFTGIFHFYKTAVKEIGGGLIVTHVSLAIALLVPLARHELSPIDAILGALILDAQGNSLSIQLVTKETLAARWQVAVALLSQLLGLLIEATLAGFFVTNRLPMNSCGCFFVFWWTWFSNCSSTSPNHRNQIVPYWIYFVYRVINIIHGAYFATTRTSIFDDAEKWDRENPCDPCDNCRKGEPTVMCKCCPCEECNRCKVCKRTTICDRDHNNQSQQQQQMQNYTHLQSIAGFCRHCSLCKRCGHSHPDDNAATLICGDRFSEATMTQSSNFLESSALALISMISLEVTMSKNKVQKASPVYAVGQVTSLIIAAWTAIRALWVFLYMFRAKPRE